MAPKRKLDENDVPQVEASKDDSTFADFGLEPRLLRGLRDQSYQSPTLCQQRVVPEALQGKDILLRSPTGTGKTISYILPLLHNQLRRPNISSLILVPTKELALQVLKVAKAISTHCGPAIRIVNIAGKESDVVIRAKLADANIIISTPARANANINNGALSLKSLAHLVVDEGDLVMGYGFKDDMAQISGQLQGSTQLFIMSATMSTDVEALQSLFGDRSPAIIKLNDLEKSVRVHQYALKCAEEDKFMLLFAMFKLQLIKGKTIVFVGDTDRSYRVKLFLEQFGIKSCVLNSELPVASRLNVVEQFNRNIYDILIASDETEVLGSKETEETNEPRPKKKAKASKSKPDAGVSRGIDFLNVSCVLNFDLGPTANSYQHRIGRTARAGKSGTAISFVIPKDKYRKHKSTFFEGAINDEAVIAELKEKKVPIEDYAFDMKRLEPFRYRFGDALRHVTRIAVREARVKELRMELSKSQKLSRYFEENPEALQHLRHDQSLTHSMRTQPHLKHVPSYLLPGGKKPEDIGFVGLEKDKDKGRRFVKRKGKKLVRGRNGKVDPLKTFNARGRGKK